MKALREFTDEEDLSGEHLCEVDEETVCAQAVTREDLRRILAHFAAEFRAACEANDGDGAEIASARYLLAKAALERSTRAIAAAAQISHFREIR